MTAVPPELPSKTDDAEIVRLLVARDEAGLRLLLAVYGQSVRASLIRKYGNRDFVMSAVQDAAKTLWDQPEKIDLSRGQLGSYFWRVAWTGVHRRLRKRGLRFVGLEDAGPIADASGSVDDEGTQPTELIAAVRAVIASLGRVQRRVVEADLVAGESASAAELADELGVTMKSIYEARSKGRLKLKARLQEMGYFLEGDEGTADEGVNDGEGEG